MRYLILFLLPLASCVSPLDEKQFAVRQQFHDVASTFSTVSTVFIKGADEMADGKHALQKKVVDQEWDSFLARHTHNGGLVSKDANGNIIPMPIEQLKESLAMREAALVQVALQEKAWGDFADDYRMTLAQFKATNDMIAEEEYDVFEAKKSAQATLDHLLNTVGSFAAGATGGALLVP